MSQPILRNVLNGRGTLVLSGGGVKGIMYIGSLRAFEKHATKSSTTIGAPLFRHVCGVSIGSFIGTLIAAGYTSNELEAVVMEKRFNELRDIRINNFVYKYGIDSGERIISWLETLLIKKGLCKDCTFETMFHATGVKLSICATNLNRCTPTVFSHLSTPRVKVTDAVRFSIGVPFLFTIKKFNGDIHVDGAILDNYPIRSIPEDELDTTIGIKIIDDLETCPVKPRSIATLQAYIYNVFACIFAHKERATITPDRYSSRTILVHTNASGAFAYNLTHDEKLNLIREGYQVAVKEVDVETTVSKLMYRKRKSSLTSHHFRNKLCNWVEREVDVLYKLKQKQCRNIVKVYGHVSSPSTYTIKLEYCNIGDLQSVLDEPQTLFLHKKSNGSLQTDVIVTILKDVCRALMDIHKLGIVHRDVKPKNILLTNEISTHRLVAKLSDFGFACALPSASDEFDFVKAGYSQLCGTPYYLAPEIVTGLFGRKTPQGDDLLYSTSVDTWALGMSLYQAMFNELPFQNVRGVRGMADLYGPCRYLIDEQLVKVAHPSARLKRVLCATLDMSGERRASAERVYEMLSEEEQSLHENDASSIDLDELREVVNCTRNVYKDAACTEYSAVFRPLLEITSIEDDEEDKIYKADGEDGVPAERTEQFFPDVIRNVMQSVGSYLQWV